mmetsp:Transcript_104360/g.238986  ORF Transcript_104360/g.238986 Transcript_104360/m.238986 type:complete len:243 (-) Transcript_104360:47-775(-)
MRRLIDKNRVLPGLGNQYVGKSDRVTDHGVLLAALGSDHSTEYHTRRHPHLASAPHSLDHSHHLLRRRDSAARVILMNKRRQAKDAKKDKALPRFVGKDAVHRSLIAIHRVLQLLHQQVHSGDPSLGSPRSNVEATDMHPNHGESAHLLQLEHVSPRLNLPEYNGRDKPLQRPDLLGVTQLQQGHRGGFREWLVKTFDGSVLLVGRCLGLPDNNIILDVLNDHWGSHRFPRPSQHLCGANLV